jgi:hypothetical protein
MSEEDHAALLAAPRHVEGKVMLSGYESDLATRLAVAIRLSTNGIHNAVASRRRGAVGCACRLRVPPPAGERSPAPLLFTKAGIRWAAPVPAGRLHAPQIGTLRQRGRADYLGLSVARS